MGEITFETFSRKMNAAASQVRNSEAAIVAAGSAGLAADVSVAYRGAAGGDGRLSGTNSARRQSQTAAPVSARSKDVRRFADGNYVGLVVPTGPYGLLERPIAPHVIGAFTVDAARRGRAAQKAIRGARKAQRGGSDVSARQAGQLARIRQNSRGGTNLRFPDGGFRRSVMHPGTPGKDVFSRAVRTAGPRATKKALEETGRQMLAGYRSGK